MVEENEAFGGLMDEDEAPEAKDSVLEAAAASEAPSELSETAKVLEYVAGGGRLDEAMARLLVAECDRAVAAGEAKHITAWCKANQVKHPTFNQWKAKLKKIDAGGAPAKPAKKQTTTAKRRGAPVPKARSGGLAASLTITTDPNTGKWSTVIEGHDAESLVELIKALS